MESTLSKIVLPYGVTVHSTTSGYMNVPDHKYKRGSAGLLLKPGPCKVQASYAGPEQVEVRLYGTSGKRNTYGLKRVLEVIPSGGGKPFVKDSHHWCRRRRLGANAGKLRISRGRTYRNHRGIPDSGHIAREVVKNDHPQRRFRQLLAVCDSLRNGCRCIHAASERSARRGPFLCVAKGCFSGAAGLHRSRGSRGVVEAYRGRHRNDQDVSDSCRPYWSAAHLQTGSGAIRWGRNPVYYDDTATKLGSQSDFYRFIAYLPTSQLAGQVV